MAQIMMICSQLLIQIEVDYRFFKLNNKTYDIIKMCPNIWNIFKVSIIRIYYRIVVGGYRISVLNFLIVFDWCFYVRCFVGIDIVVHTRPSIFRSPAPSISWPYLDHWSFWPVGPWCLLEISSPCCSPPRCDRSPTSDPPCPWRVASTYPSNQLRFFGRQHHDLRWILI